MSISYISTLEAKEQFSEIINRVAHNKERIVLLRRGKEIAAMVPLEDLHLLETTQTKNDLQDATDALQEARSAGFVTLDEFKKHLE